MQSALVSTSAPVATGVRSVVAPSKALSFAPLRTAAPRAARVVTRAEASEEKSGLAQFSASIGMPVDEGVFGFTPFAEQFVGRMSMLGFIFSIVGEATSGKGTLAQIGVATPSTPLCVGLVSGTIGVSLLAILITINDARIGKMSPAQVRRYAGLLGLKSKAVEKREIAETQAFLKMSQNDAEAPAADKFLALDDDAAIKETAAEMKAEASAVATEEKPAPVEEEPKEFKLYDEASELAYARNIEIGNGRWAMFGFWIAIVIEAQTGHGIILQLIDWFKYSGLLGADSGF